MKISSDKILHFTIAYAMTLTLTLFYPIIGLVAGISVCILKEVYDYFDYGRSTKGFIRMALGDLVADGLGIILSVIVRFLL